MEAGRIITGEQSTCLDTRSSLVYTKGHNLGITRLPPHQGFIFTWLIGSSVVLGPIGGIAIADYYLTKRQRLDIDALYSTRPGDAYWYWGGWNPAALLALLAGAAPCVPGLISELTGCTVAAIWTQLYHCCWFVGFFLAAGVYVAASKAAPQAALASEF